MYPKGFSEFLFNISTRPLRVLNNSIKNVDYIAIDLSRTNENLSKIDVSSSSKLEQYIDNYIKSNNVLVAYGGYLEVRNIYKRSTHFNKYEEQTERNIHLGIDLWCDLETLIYTPFDATVHSFRNNDNYGDYGPTIILKHEIDEVEFYTLYGHLSLASIENLEVGNVFKNGDCIGYLGDASVNGDYPPHLHFQIIKDLQGLKGDYLGVCNKTDIDFYKLNCPNPNLLLKL